MTICFGTTLGYLCLWRLTPNGVIDELLETRIGGGKEILSIQGDKPTINDIHFAVGTGIGHIQLWKYDNNGLVATVWAVSVGATIPRKVAFSHMMIAGTEIKTVVAFGNRDGQV